MAVAPDRFGRQRQPGRPPRPGTYLFEFLFGDRAYSGYVSALTRIFSKMLCGPGFLKRVGLSGGCSINFCLTEKITC